jgi:hypothetical protein
LIEHDIATQHQLSHVPFGVFIGHVFQLEDFWFERF